ncbi:hypothetical protein D3C77_632500 [compost metagenome]
MWHQYHFHRHAVARGNRLGLVELDATFGQHHGLWRTELPQQGLRNNRAKQVDTFVLRFEESGQGTVLVAELAQQVLRLEFAQVQFAEQVEEW